MHEFRLSALMSTHATNLRKQQSPPHWQNISDDYFLFELHVVLLQAHPILVI